jgi:hypothetical protein
VRWRVEQEDAEQRGSKAAGDDVTRLCLAVAAQDRGERNGEAERTCTLEQEAG